MKYIAIIFACFSISFYASAYSIGSSETGPNVECQFSDGHVKFIPILICEKSGGKVLR
ncbi:hypothetical protein GCM10026988_23960 [Vibrio panuliri]